MAEAKSKFVRYFPAIAVMGVIILVGFALFGLMNLMQDDEGTQKKKVQFVTVLPPPPPPPPKEEEPPPPEEEEVEIEEEQEPEEVPDDVASDEPPPGELLGLDADGAAGQDGFGLLAKKGGRGLLDGGGPFAWYKGILQKYIFEALNDRKDLRRKSYEIRFQVWISEAGQVEDVQIEESSGDTRIDEVLQMAVLGMGEVQTPPLEMPQPVTLKIVSRL